MKPMRKFLYLLLVLAILWNGYFSLYEVVAQNPMKSQIIFVSKRSGQERIYAMDEDGQNVRRLVFIVSGGDRWPAWSPNGYSIVFQSDQKFIQTLYIMDLRENDPRMLTLGFGPSWSPDGKRIAFASYQQSWGIYIIDINGQNIKKMAEEGENRTGPIWSPDGRKIAFISDRDGKRNVYAMDADSGKSVQKLTNWNIGIGVNSSAWSPNGRKIIFDAISDNGESDIYIMNADGTDIQRLTDNPAYDIQPKWLDDQRIVFVSGRDGNSEIYVMNVDGGNLRNITNDPERDAEPSCWPGYFSKWAVSPAGKLPYIWGWIKK